MSIYQARRSRLVAFATALAIASGTTLAVAAPSLPLLWTAGGLDAGTTGAGQAARVVTDAFGNVSVVSGPAGRDLAVTSYTANGALRWRRTVAPASGTFVADWIAAAPNGDILAVGRPVNSSGTPINITLVRYATDGTLQWRIDLAKTFPGVGRLLTDAAGDAYLLFNSLGDGQDVVLQKYSAAGSLLWEQVVQSGALANDIGTSLALSPDGSEIGLSGAASGGAVWTTALFNAQTGVRKWLVVAPEGIGARDLIIDASRVYVAGIGNVGTAQFLTAIAYDRTTGLKLWRTDKKSADSTLAQGYRMAFTPDGNFVVTGAALRGFLDWYTVKFNTSGSSLWEAVRDGGLNTDEMPASVLTLANGTTVVTGVGGPNLPGGFIPGVTAGYDANGVLIWEAFAAQASAWSTTLLDGNVCATGGYDALITCWNVSGTATAPNAPSNMTATLSGASVVLGWTDNSNNETSFTLEKCAGVGCTNFATLTTLNANFTAFADGAIMEGNSYSYRVRANSNAGSSAYSNVATVSIPVSVPTAPSNLIATGISRTSIRLNWTNTSTNQTEVRIERCQGGRCSNFAQIAVAPGTAVTYTDATLTSRTSFSYRVCAHNTAGDSPYSNVAVGTPTR